MHLRSVQTADILTRLPGLLARSTANAPAAFGEVSVMDMQARIPRGRGVALGSAGTWSALAYAVPNPDGSAWTMEMAADPDDVDADEFVTAAAAHFVEAGIDDLVLWIHDPQVLIEGTPFVLERTLHRMTLSLPVDEIAHWPDGVTISGFTVEDSLDWLEVNNRAFAGHPEQSGWTVEDIERRRRLAWFDPTGVRLIRVDGRLAAFNWTKVHQVGDAIVGEIYVIAVDPDFHGQGLGRAGTLEGLSYLYERRGASRAILYVDEGNVAGMALYGALGFVSEEIHRAFRFQPSPSRPPSSPN